jgi:hypothetical protein
MRSFDFDRIHNEFVTYYKGTGKGETEYYDWLRALKLDESKPYSQCQESFRWAKDMLKFLKEDEDNKYYQITVGFPVRSMNGNLYKERDLIAAALSLKGKHPSLNHKDEFWFRPGNRWGTLTAIDGKYEDGAVEAILQVPKTAVCPICDGAKMTELIDSKRIVNISLEGDCKGGQCVTGECEGFTFLDPPFTLLTSDVLPGIPLARIKPLEAVMVEALQASSKGEKKRMKLKPTIKEDMPTYPKPNVQTDTITTDGPIVPIATSVDADTKIDTPLNSSGNSQVLTGSSPADIVMKQHERKVGEPCSPELKACVDALIADGKPEDSAWAICKSKLGESAEPKYAGEPPSFGSDTSVPKPEDIRTGPPRTKAPEFATTLAGKLPLEDDTELAMGTSVVTHGIMTGTSPVEGMSTVEQIKARVNAQSEAKSAKDDVAKWEKAHDERSKQLLELGERYNKLQGVISNQKTRIETLETKRDEAFKDMHNSQIERDEWHSKYEHQLGIVEDLKTQLGKTQEQQSRATEKYSQTLKTNLELSQKLTKANEDYLEVAKAKEDVEEKLTTARTNAKKTLKLRI